VRKQGDDTTAAWAIVDHRPDHVEMVVCLMPTSSSIGEQPREGAVALCAAGTVQRESTVDFEPVLVEGTPTSSSPGSIDHPTDATAMHGMRRDVAASCHRTGSDGRSGSKVDPLRVLSDAVDAHP
jgi:hypothetical protein